MSEKIIQIIARFCDTPISEINESTNLLSDLHMESMNFIDMVCELEEQFNRKIPERDFRKLITVKKIKAYLGDVAETKKASLEHDDTNQSSFKKSHCVVSPMTGRLAETIPELVMSVYGANYPATYLYKPEEFKKKADNGEIYPYIAINGDGKAAGMISLIRLSVNKNAFELGQLMVAPEYRGTDVAELLISCISHQELKFGVIYSESVTGHLFSQRSCIADGFTDTALKLNIMPAYQEDNNGRVSCVVSCIERGELELWAYLPQAYKDSLVFSMKGLSPRVFRNASDTAPDNPTCYEINSDELLTSQYIIISFTEIGADSERAVNEIEKYALDNEIKSMAVKLPLSCPHNGQLVNALREKGYFFGGVMPRWYEHSDGLLMQKLYSNTADWDSIKLFSEKIQGVAEIIKKDV